MNLVEMYEMQRELDNTVQKRLGEGYDPTAYYSIESKIYAFHTEMHELANEVAFFKVWKQSHQMDRSDTLEELVDAIHFLLSLANVKGYNRIVKEVETFPLWEEYSMLDLFNEVRKNDLDTCRKYEFVFSLILGIAKKLDYSELEIQYAYSLKNEENISRQMEGY